MLWLNHWNLLKMAAIFSFKRTISIERFITFENESHQTKAGKNCHFSLLIQLHKMNSKLLMPPVSVFYMYL